MGTALKQIEQEIEEIEVAIAIAKTKIQSAFLEYTQAVAQASQQQIIMAVYQICTRDYPAAFLALSLDERYKLQQEVQAVAKSLVTRIEQSLCECHQQSDQDEVDRLLTKTMTEVAHTVNEFLSTARIMDLTAATADDTAQKVQLSLSEVEYTNRSVMSPRGELRVLSARLNQLHNELEKKLKAKIIAEAELAWRSSWS